MTILEELQAKMSKAITNNDVKEIEAIAQEIVKSKGERVKAQAEGLRKEAEQLAGVRADLAEAIRKAIDSALPNLTEQLTRVRCDEFRYQAKGKLDSAGVPLAKSAVGLNVPVIKTHKGGTGGSGKTKDEFDMSLDELYGKFANPDEQAKFAEAELADNKHAQEHGLSTPKQSNRWRVKNDVKKRALADGLITPTK